MSGPLLFRALLAVAVPVFIMLRLRAAQRQPFPERELDATQISGLVISMLADVIGVVLALGYILDRSLLAWEAGPSLPTWLRWLGAFVLLGSMLLLAGANRQLPQRAEPQGADETSPLPESGPYRWIRHPVYLSILLAYLGAGVMSSDLALAFVPGLLHLGAIVRVVAREESLLRDYQGHQQASQLQRTGMFFPPWHRIADYETGPDGPSDRSEADGADPGFTDESNQT